MSVESGSASWSINLSVVHKDHGDMILTQLDEIWKTTSVFVKMEDNLNFKEMEDDLNFCYLKTTSIFKKEKNRYIYIDTIHISKANQPKLAVT